MKKLLLSLSLCCTTFCTFAQVILSENFDSYFPGNVNTDITGVTPTNNFYTIASNGTAPTTATNAGNDNFQIVVNDASHQNVLQITGTNGDKGSRNLWYGDFTTSWDFRDAGTNIIEAEFELYTGTTSASYNRMGVYIYDTTRTKILGGYSFNTNTLVLSGVAYYTSATAPIGNYLFYLGSTAGTNLTLTANTWIRFGVSFNKTTGQIIWKGIGLNGQVTGAAATVDPDRISFVSTSGTTTTAPVVTNAASTSVLYDNINTRASSTDTLLAVNQVAAPSAYAVYPNPASSVVTVSSKANAGITSISLTDLNGRIVKQNTMDNLATVQINISDLATGVYMMKINSKEGTTIQKIIKN